MMGTRRPMSRVPSSNGRYYDSHGSSNGSTSESEDSNGSVYNARADSRNYLLNVRPENRTTFCSIISQLTEETQPCFETTLKTRAVSEGCDAKFICMVTGYPEPEITWYKDDEEMDRYCGLPKYEIMRHGKRHTLQIYKCCEEDAAIYQASARNNKGIVTCSGVLEVGTMTEYKIHQRWFAKLKRKAEAKMREIEQSRRRVKENLEEGERLRALSPERIQRKRRFSSEYKEDTSSLSLDKEDLIKVHIPDPSLRLQEETTNVTEQTNRVVNGYTVPDTPQKEEVTTNGYALPQNIDDQGKDFLAYVFETVEVISKKTISKEVYAKKKKKEEDPPSTTKADATKEEVPLGSSPKKVEGSSPKKVEGSSPKKVEGSSPKKVEGISPSPRRSRFSKDTNKAPADDKMEVQPVPVLANRRFGNLSTPNKFGKPIGKEPKKPKEVMVPPGKAEESPIQKQGPQLPKEEVNFSLKDMYFGVSDSLPVGDEKVSPASEKDRASKTGNHVARMIKQNGHPLNKMAPPVQVKEAPKAAPRRSREQRDQTAGSKPPTASLNKKNEILNTTSVVENLRSRRVEKTSDKQKPVVGDTFPVPIVPLDSIPLPDISEQTHGKDEKAEPLPVNNVRLETPDVLKEEKAIIAEDEKYMDELRGQVKARTSSEDLPEAIFQDNARTETIQKLQQLEVEYMALQKAYALLQKQLELSQKEEAKKAAEKSLETSTESQSSNNETTFLDAQEDVINKEDLLIRPTSPESIYMETGETVNFEEAPTSDSRLQDDHEGTRQVSTSEVPSLRSPDSPVTFMDCSTEEEATIKDDSVIEEKPEGVVKRCALPPTESQKEDKPVHHEVSQQDEHLLTVKEMSTSSIVTLEVPNSTKLSNEIEMMEVSPQPELVVSVKEDKIESERSLEVSLVDKSNDSPPVITDTMGILDVESGALEKSSSNLSEEQKDFPDINIVETDLPGAISSEKLVVNEPNQSVATLLRDVKKALESGLTKDEVSPLETSPCSPLSPTTEMYFELETQLPLPQQKQKNVTEDRTPHEIQEIPPKTMQLPSQIDPPTEEPDLTIQPEIHQKEIIRGDLMSKPQSKQDHSLVTSLKNSLLKLLHMKTDEAEPISDAKSVSKVADSPTESPVDMCSPQGSLSPPSPRKNFSSRKDNGSTQSAESMHSSSTSGKLTPASEEDMIQNADSLQTSPNLLRRATEPFKKKEVTEVSSAPMSPVIPKRSSKVIYEETLLSKDDLRFSPSTSRKIAARIDSDTDYPSLSVPCIVVGSLPAEKTLGSAFFDMHRGSNRKWRSTENVSLIPSATPEELASGARRKIYLPKSKQLEDADTGSAGSLSPPSKKGSPNVSPGLPRKSNNLLTSQSPPVEKRSPGMTRKMATLEVPKIYEETTDKEDSPDGSLQPKVSNTLTKDTPAPETKKVNDPYKAPQVIRKIRAEQFSDASGNLKIWCQFFNVLSDSSITWYKDEIPVAKIKRSSGDEGQVALAIVQASAKDCGVYQCTIENDYGTDSTDCLLSAEILSGFITKEEAEVGEEIEMTPMVFAKGLAESGYWGDKFFGRIVMENAHVGEGFLRKACRVKVIYGLDPMFESGKTCIIKIRNLITFGTKNESTLVEKNYEITIQDCKIQNSTREYCKIFATECRALPNFGQLPEVLLLNLIYRPANNIPYATIEDDLEGHFEKYCIRDITGKLHAKNTTEIEQKCCTFQHWVYQWTNGNFLVTNLEGVGWKLTNIGIVTKSKGYHGLNESCCPEVIEEFLSVHKCNSYCDMLGLKSLKAAEGLQPPPKPKGSKSPSIGRKSGSAQSSPQIQKKSLTQSPQTTRKGGVSPKATRKATETGDTHSPLKNKGGEESPPAKPQ